MVVDFSSLLLYGLLFAGNSHKGLAMNALHVRGPGAERLVVLMGFTGEDAPWLINEVEPFVVRYYDNDKKELKAVHRMIRVGEVPFDKVSLINVPCETNPAIGWIRVDFGFSGLRSPFTAVNGARAVQKR